LRDLAALRSVPPGLRGILRPSLQRAAAGIHPAKVAVGHVMSPIRKLAGANGPITIKKERFMIFTFEFCNRDSKSAEALSVVRGRKFDFGLTDAKRIFVSGNPSTQNLQKLHAPGAILEL
jgi:hypothetical protein